MNRKEFQFNLNNSPTSLVVEAYDYYRKCSAYKIRSETKFIAVHCADTNPLFKGDITDIRHWHINERGWLDVGYHYVITRSGVIQTGRPLWSVGSHVEGFNSSSIGICLMGGKYPSGLSPTKGSTGRFSTLSDIPRLYTPEQMTSLAFLLANLSVKYKDPSGLCIQGHRDFPNVMKSCPGFDVGAWIAADLPHTSARLKNLGDYEVYDHSGIWA